MGGHFIHGVRPDSLDCRLYAKEPTFPKNNALALVMVGAWLKSTVTGWKITRVILIMASFLSSPPRISQLCLRGPDTVVITSCRLQGNGHSEDDIVLIASSRRQPCLQSHVHETNLAQECGSREASPVPPSPPAPPQDAKLGWKVESSGEWSERYIRLDRMC